MENTKWRILFIGGAYEKNDDGRERGGKLRFLRFFGTCRDLPHHAVLPHGGARRQVASAGQTKSVRAGSPSRADAIGERRGGRLARMPDRRCFGNHVHVQPRAPADDSRYVQDRGRVASHRRARQRPSDRHPRAQHFWRSSGRNGDAADGVCDACVLLRTGMYGSGSRRPPCHFENERALFTLFRRIPHLARTLQNRRFGQRGNAASTR